MAVQKIVVGILAVMYLGLTSGLAVNIQYCMGKISAIEIDNISTKNNKCSKTNLPCCGHKSLLVKVSDWHQATDNNFKFHSPEALLPAFGEKLFSNNNIITQTVQVAAHAPPDIPPCIYIKNCVFRI